MNSKVRIVALCGIMCAVAVACCIGAAYVNWVALSLAVIASVAVAVPTIVNAKYLVYSLLCYFVSTILSVWLGFANIGQVVPIVVFALPFAIVKAYGESPKTTITTTDEDGTTTTRGIGKKLPTFVKWLLYYMLAEVALALTALSLWLFMPAAFERLWQNNWLVYLLIIAQLVVPLYNVLMNGCFVIVRKTVKRFFVE